MQRRISSACLSALPMPRVERREQTRFVNLGNAGSRGFTLPISIGELLINGAQVTARTAVLNPPSTRFV